MLKPENSNLNFCGLWDDYINYIKIAFRPSTAHAYITVTAQASSYFAKLHKIKTDAAGESAGDADASVDAERRHHLATYAILRPFMEMFISIASFILSSGYLCVSRSVTGRPLSWASLRKSKLCTQSLAW